MHRYYVELKRSLKDQESTHVYVKAYNREHVTDMFVDYYIVAVDQTD
jgi:hypothetical protein